MYGRPNKRIKNLECVLGTLKFAGIRLFDMILNEPYVRCVARDARFTTFNM